MEALIINSSPQTPSIHFCAETGLMQIRGRSIPDQPDEFWGPILSWFDSYVNNPAEATTISIDLEYFNITSSKRILFLLYKLNELVDLNLEAKVIWMYRDTDEDMYEVGQDYAYMVKVPFEFKVYIESDLITV
jgi:hypothetical protein